MPNTSDFSRRVDIAGEKKQIFCKQRKSVWARIQLTHRRGGEVVHLHLDSTTRWYLQIAHGDVSLQDNPQHMVTHRGGHTKNRAGSCRGILKEHPPGLIRTNLSHLSLLFLQGSQFIAFRVRFAGRPSSWISRVGELDLGRTSCFVGTELMIAGRDTFRCLEA